MYSMVLPLMSAVCVVPSRWACSCRATSVKLCPFLDNCVKFAKKLETCKYAHRYFVWVPLPPKRLTPSFSFQWPTNNYSGRGCSFIPSIRSASEMEYLPSVSIMMPMLTRFLIRVETAWFVTDRASFVSTTDLI